MSIYFIWFLIGVAFLIAEFIIPTFILFFFAIGAFIVSILTIFYDFSMDSQIILFALSSVISLVLLRKYMKNIFKGKESIGEDKFTNRVWASYFDNSNENIAIVSKAIDANSFGEIKYKGTFYKAHSENAIDEGEKVKVIKRGDEQGSFFIVEAINN